MLSFNGNKIMTTSGGGMLLTEDSGWPRTCASCRPRPESRSPTTSTPRSATTTGSPTSSPRSGRAQLARLDEMLKRRREWRERYRSLFARPARRRDPRRCGRREDNCWLTAIVVDPGTSPWTAADADGRHGHSRHRVSAGMEAYAPPARLERARGDSRRHSRTHFRERPHPPGRLGPHGEQFEWIESTIRQVVTARLNRYDPVKRGIDVVVGGVALVLSFPVQLVVAVLVRVKLGRPVLFRQERPGKDGRIFQLVKFRTMQSPTGRTDSCRMRSGSIPFGAFLRSTSLDELPTLWNVVKGDMSLVGPRPLLVQYLDRYTREQAVAMRCVRASPGSHK